MATLGDYTVPKGKAGKDYALCAGSGSHGLQKEFESTVLQFIRDELEKPYGITVELGTHGYVGAVMSESDKRHIHNNTQKAYQKYILYFGWGAAWDVLDAKDKDGKSINLYDFCWSGTGRDRGPSQKFGSYGISVTKATYDGEVALVFFHAIVKESTDAEKVEYGGSDGTSVASSASSTSLSSASYFFANQFNSIQDVGLANMLQGERALANDVDLWTYVKKAVNSSLRACASDPDGNFIAWYPDYYGKYGTTPHIIIKDIELENLVITQSDSEFYSHVFCPGVTIGGSKMSMLITTGVVSIESDTAAAYSSGAALYEGEDIVSDEVSPILSRIMNIPEGEEWKYTPRELYRRYGARPAKTNGLPNYTSSQVIEDTEGAKEGQTPEHILPYLYALYEFMYHWANQYQATIEITFMPELFPGMRIKVESLDIEFYVQSVSHSMSYTSGFTTKIKAICPVGSLVSGMVASTPRGV